MLTAEGFNKAVFLALSLFAVSLFQEAPEQAPPGSTTTTDHVIICSYTQREGVFRTEIGAAGVPYVLIEIVR